MAENKKWKAGQLVTLKYKKTKLLCRIVKSKTNRVCGNCNFDYLPILFCHKYCNDSTSKMPDGHYFKILLKYVDYG